eukprot:TRINITY_DN73_c3_g1_i1.p8 TRINITY_DN73_c3_g1~~TRINITY_DN73_c3_g1_i1.p8  ORF type:complete len:232 (+),score=25.14 TRINITY_DN73_c3_g1_i1:5218-5913(+)
MAPEIFSNNEYKPESDIYSCGMVLYFMLFGALPFNGTTRGEVLAQNKKNNINFSGYKWSKISKEAKDFILELTNTNSDMRPTAEEALESVWFERTLEGEPIFSISETEIVVSGPSSSCNPYRLSNGPSESIPKGCIKEDSKALLLKATASKPGVLAKLYPGNSRLVTSGLPGEKGMAVRNEEYKKVFHTNQRSTYEAGRPRMANRSRFAPLSGQSQVYTIKYIKHYNGKLY